MHISIYFLLFLKSVMHKYIYIFSKKFLKSKVSQVNDRKSK